MKIAYLFVLILSVFSLFISSSEARPGKIPVKAIKSGAKAIGKGLRAVNIAGTVHDVVSIFNRRKKKH